MQDCNNVSWGAKIDKGTIMTAVADGFTVKSDMRDGIITPVIKAIINKNHAVGDKVYFALFEDGDGIILN